MPNVIFDLILYEERSGPICISAKTTLRERYKQADLESMALKSVHRSARSYLICDDKKAAANLKSKISSGDVLGLDDVLFIDSHDFDLFIKKLKLNKYIKPSNIAVISDGLILE